MIMEQPYMTKKTLLDCITEAKIYRKPFPSSFLPMVMEQPCKTKKTLLDHKTEAKKYRKELEWWDESIPLSYLYMGPLPSVLESPNPFNGKGGPIDEMMTKNHK